MLDKSIFEKLSTVNGYMGAVLSDYTGEVLVSETQKVKKLDETSMRFNETFRNIQEVTDVLGLGHAKTLDIAAEHAVVIMISSGQESRVLLHAFAILTRDASVGLAKIALQDVIEKAARELS